jgi:hypothetical protein
VDQFALPASPRAAIGHTRPPEAIDPIEGLTARLAANHADLVARLLDLEVGCARVPDPIGNKADAATAPAFIAQCQAQIRTAEAAHRKEKDLFLKAGRAVDTFFKRRCDKLRVALAPAVARLKTYRDRVAEAERQRHAEARRLAAEAARRAAAEEAEHRAAAERLARDATNAEARRQAAQHLRLAEDAAERAAAAGQQAAITLEPTRIRGDYGATAYVTRSWVFEVVDLDRVPREYLSLDHDVVREAINKDGVRDIPGLRIYQAESLRVRGAA